MIEITKISSQNDMDDCFHIRTKVFVEEQNVPLDEEMDGHDKDADHYLLRLKGKATATARVRILGDVAKIERVAVLKSERGLNIGRKLMEFIMADIQKNKTVTLMKLGAQVQVIPFYENLGFISHGDEFLDAGIKHRWMTCNI